MLATAVKERRARSRVARQGKVKIFWTDDGGSRQELGQIRDMSAQGLCCNISQRLSPGMLVRIECSPEHLHGDAVVRHCEPKGITYNVGLEFRGSLNWRGATDTPTQKCWD